MTLKQQIKHGTIQKVCQLHNGMLDRPSRSNQKSGD